MFEKQREFNRQNALIVACNELTQLRFFRGQHLKVVIFFLEYHLRAIEIDNLFNAQERYLLTKH